MLTHVNDSRHISPEGAAHPTITPWERLSDLIGTKNEDRELQSQVLVKLAQFAGLDLLPWSGLMPMIRQKFSTGYVRSIEEALTKSTSVQYSLSRSERSRRACGSEEPGFRTRKAKRRKGS